MFGSVLNRTSASLIQESIAELQGRMDSQPGVDDSEVDHLRRQIDLLSSLQTPIRRIPRELLSEIFLQPSLHCSPRYPFRAPRGTKTILSVSHHWRETALSTAEFWAEFDVILHGNSNQACLLELYLERSKQFPLSISILAWRTGIWDPRILQLLIGSCERWAHLRLTMDSCYLPLLSPLRGHLPLLLRLDLSLHKGRILLDTPQFSSTAQPDAFEITPRLTALSMNVDFDAITPLLPHSQIKSLVIVNWASLLFAVNCPNLHSLSFCRTSVEFRRHGLSSAVEISTIVLHAFPLVLKFITALAVQVLDLDTLASDTTLSMDIWTPFIRRSACRPHTLQLHNLAIPSRDLLSILVDLPSLQTVVLRGLDRPDVITTNLLTQLTLSPSGTGAMVLPELTDLTIAGSYIFTNVSFLAMLESRSDSIERVTLELKQRTFTAEELDRARALKEQRAMELTLWCVDAEKSYVHMI